MTPKKKNKKLATAHAPWKVKDYSNEPFFIQKEAASRRIMRKYRLPIELSIAKK